MQEKIMVTQADAPDQYIVENNFSDLGGTFFERYVCFSGYFGSHGPHVFAAGPALYEALLEARGALKSKLEVIDAALAKARGES